MAKKAKSFDDAQKLYVQEQLSLAVISSALNVSERTLIEWKKQGGWQEKRDAFSKEQKSLHEDLYSFSRALLKSVTADLEAGKEPSPAKLYAIAKYIPNFQKVKDYEDGERSAKDAPITINKDDIFSAITQVLGA